MITIYIKKLENEEKNEKIYSKLIKKIKKFIIYKFNILQIKQIEENKKIYLIPNINKTSTYKKVLKNIKKENTKTEKVQIVLENEIKQYKQYFQGYKIVDGRSTFMNSIEGILKNILCGNLLELQDIYILTNYYYEKNVNLIRSLASKVKTVNVVTREIQKYENMECMMEEWGVPIVISNNKRKSLKKAKIIVNLDFTKDVLEQYTIYRNAVIINLMQEKINNLKDFEGIIIKDIRNRFK